MFILDSKLKMNSIFIKSLSLSDLLLMNDNRFPWFILVPRQKDCSEIFDLNFEDQIILWQEITQCASWAKNYFAADKMNVAALGNIVTQLHVHVVARKKSDPAWPKPIWNQGESSCYDINELELLVKDLRLSLESLKM